MESPGIIPCVQDTTTGFPAFSVSAKGTVSFAPPEQEAPMKDKKKRAKKVEGDNGIIIQGRKLEAFLSNTVDSILQNYHSWHNS
jgi:hypothetical protein